MAVTKTPIEDVAGDFHRPAEHDGVALWWLGQAGFLLRHNDLRLAVDPYLSDSLAEKYRGTPFPHRRIMAAPVAAGALTELDFVFCTHSHTDHMDPGTLPDMARASPRCRFVVPAAERMKAMERGVPPDRLILVAAGDVVVLSGNFSAAVVPAAHEERWQDGEGHDFFLGYKFRAGEKAVYHSGDCVPFDDLGDWLGVDSIDVALLPVNGRDARRKANGIPGNFHLLEAIALCRNAAIPLLLGHHFGMFDFNTIEVEAARSEIRSLGASSYAELIQPMTRYDIR
ncbi:MBL fold metallo-hydrolase [Mesorhizobium sp. IMUNJ 23232]|uniref:MBL fold metallo-hydrolase n=1 Tax=Mesorhizobium sp. IMUNJ 23232 TaxID=3376064 RepID=UPI0037BA1DEE